MNDENLNNNINEPMDVNISSEIKTSFLDYSMSVIVSRALPDVRDGLKPVHRRIIYAMTKLGITSSSSYKKSARIVGEVIGKYHPHGDTSVYEAMVKMAQPFNYLHPLVEGQGNFGSLDGDSPAAMRYTEAKLSKLSNYFIKDLDKDTVPFAENYDSSEREPLFLPCTFPNLLVNGSYGIAVGLATNIPPHNLGEVIDATIELVKNENITTKELMKFIKGPDFPTGAIIADKNLYDAYHSGNGSVVIRAKAEIVKSNNKKFIIITEVPYRINKMKLLEKIAELVTKKQINDIASLRDESNHKGVRIVIQLKKNAQEQIVLNKLYKLSPLQSSFSLNMVALDNNQPKVLSIKNILQAFINHYILLIVKRSKFDYNNCVKRIHILKGLVIALDNIDAVISILKKSADTKDALITLEKKYELSNEQSRAILEMKLQKLTGLEKNKIITELDNLEKMVEKLLEIINSKEKQIEILIKEQQEIKAAFAVPRRTLIFDDNFDIKKEELIKKEETVIVLTKNNYIKRLNKKEFLIQKRNGKGIRILNKEFSISKVLSASTLDDILIFTDKQMVYRIKAHNINKYDSNNAKGLPLINLLPQIQNDEKINSIIAINEDDHDKNLLFFTKQGRIKKTSLTNFIKTNGVKSFKLHDNDLVINSSMISNDEKLMILIGTKSGKLVKFENSQIRKSGKVAFAISGISIKNSKIDEVVSGCSNYTSNNIVFVSENGIGKIVDYKEFRTTKRNSTGVKSFNLTDKTGMLQKFMPIKDNEDLIIISKKGFVIRIANDNIPRLSRNSSGVYLIKLNSDDKVENIETLKVDE